MVPVIVSFPDIRKFQADQRSGLVWPAAPKIAPIPAEPQKVEPQPPVKKVEAAEPPVSKQPAKKAEPQSKKGKRGKRK